MQRKSLLAMLLSIVLVLALVAGCSNSDDKEKEGKDEPKKDPEPKEKVEITLWYGWTNQEGAALEEVIKEFNESQDRIVVKGSYIDDYAKEMTAITAGNPPDIASQFGTNSVPWGVQGAMTPLDDYIAKSKLDLGQFSPAAIQQQQYDGKTYALPINMHTSLLLYNKDLLAEAGYDGPPETVQELYEYMDKLSVINPDGKIERLGLYPALDVYAYSYIFGGSFFDFGKNEITPQSPGLIKAMQQNANLWKKFGGSEKLNAFTGSLGGYDSPENPFFTGKYAMTIDGEWLPTFIKKHAPNLNYGIAPLPYDAEHPELKGAGMINTSTFFIPKGAKHPDEAWEFLNWFVQKENVIKFAAAIGNLPPRIDSFDDPIFADVPGFKDYLEYAKNPNMKSFPGLPFMNEYMGEIGAAHNEVLLGNMTAENGAKQIADKMKPIIEAKK